MDIFWQYVSRSSYQIFFFCTISQCKHLNSIYYPELQPQIDITLDEFLLRDQFSCDFDLFISGFSNHKIWFRAKYLVIWTYLWTIYNYPELENLCDVEIRFLDSCLLLPDSIYSMSFLKMKHHIFTFLPFHVNK